MHQRDNKGYTPSTSTSSSAAGYTPSTTSSSTSISVGTAAPTQLINMIAPLDKKVGQIEAQLYQAQGQLRELDPTNPLALQSDANAKYGYTGSKAKANIQREEESDLSRRQFPNGTSPLTFTVPAGATIESLSQKIIDLRKELIDSSTLLQSYRDLQKHQREHPYEAEQALAYGKGDTMTPERPHQPPSQEQSAQGDTVVGSTVGEKENGGGK
ncbi:hypothetical protein Slin14017_G036620 [Septoria linicola]|nr:hypothetical protein Slin14017_G036620 [Septoria linicola]